MTAAADEPSLTWVADRCLRVAFGEDLGRATQARVLAAVEALARAAPAGLEDVTPAYASVLATFDLARLDAHAAEGAVRRALLGAPPPAAPGAAGPGRRVQVPTCYGGACGPDLEEVARRAGLSAEQVVARHAGAEYGVRFLGFSPGFPYLDGLPEELAVPRLERPRRRVPAGSVAVAGRQAGIYPQATPGGWRLLGRTPLLLFDAARAADEGGPALLGLGDRVRFVPITHAEHETRAAGRA